MFNEGEAITPDGNIETEAKKPVEVWVLDDNTDLTRAMLRGWDSVGEGYQFGSYATAKEALDEILTRIDNNQPIPNIIFIDGNLDADEGDLRKGENFVTKVRSLEDIVQPYLIAHSTMKEANKKMTEAGADIAMEKGTRVTLRDYLNFFRDFGQEKVEKE